MIDPIKIFIDSGAFSAKSKGVEIDIKQYIAWLKKYEDNIEIYANLDVIGDAEATWKNQEIMEASGLHPLPVYHVEDDVKHLYRCLDNYGYFCLGGMAVGYNKSDRNSFIDRCFSIICDTPENIPKAKVHGFGMTSLSLLFRYPWYSVDSTAWVMTSRMGSIFVPVMKEGQFDYEHPPIKVTVSNRSGGSKDKNKGVEKKHINYINRRGGILKEVISSYFKLKGFCLGHSEIKTVHSGYKPKDNERWFNRKENKVEIKLQPGLSNDYLERDKANIIYFNDLEKSMKKWPWPWKSTVKAKNNKSEGKRGLIY